MPTPGTLDSINLQGRILPSYPRFCLCLCFSRAGTGAMWLVLQLGGPAWSSLLGAAAAWGAAEWPAGHAHRDCGCCALRGHAVQTAPPAMHPANCPQCTPEPALCSPHPVCSAPAPPACSASSGRLGALCRRAPPAAGQGSMTRRSAARDPPLGVPLAALVGRSRSQRGEEGNRAYRRSAAAVRDRPTRFSARMRAARRRRHCRPVSEALGAGGRQSGGNGEAGGPAPPHGLCGARGRRAAHARL